jgi:hypothetical protein
MRIHSRTGLHFRWRSVAHFYLCRLFGHRMHAPGESWHFRSCQRCHWAPTETPEPSSPVGAFYRGWWSLLPVTKK